MRFAASLFVSGPALLLGLAALAPAPARAQALTGLSYNPSLPSDTSFFLFRNDFDYLQDPSRLAPLDTHSLYTLLANQGQSNSYSIGLGAPLGAGGVAFFLSAAGSGTDVTTLTEERDPSTLALQNQYEQHAWNRTRSLRLYAAYGLPVGPVYAGLGARVGIGTSSASADSGLDYAGPNYTYEDYVDNYTETLTGGYQSSQGSYALVFSVLAGNPEEAMLEADLSLRAAINRATVSVNEDSEGYTSSVEGIYGGTPSGSSNGFLVGLKLNPELQVNPTLRLEGMLAAELGLLGLAQNTLTASVLYSGESASQKLDQETVYDANGLGQLELLGWGAARFQLNPTVELRMGLGYQHWRSSFDLDETETTTSISTLGDQSTTYVSASTTNSTQVSSAGALLAPVALQLRVSDKLKLLLGAQYVLYLSRTDSSWSQVSQTLDGEPQPVDTGVSSQQSSQSSSYLETAVGMSVDPTPRVTLDFALSRYPLNGDRFAYTGSAFTLVGAATVHW